MCDSNSEKCIGPLKKSENGPNKQLLNINMYFFSFLDLFSVVPARGPSGEPPEVGARPEGAVRGLPVHGLQRGEAARRVEVVGRGRSGLGGDHPQGPV